MKTFLYPYKDGSASAKALASALGIKRVCNAPSKFKGGGDKTIINWGASKINNPQVNRCIILNEPTAITLATNKLFFFNRMDADLVVPWTTNRIQVNEWLSSGKRVVARHILTGHSGQGIEILEGSYLPEGYSAPLYTLYVPKKHEYRVHCYRRKDGGVEVFDVQQKKRKADVPDDDVDWRVRNLAGGFIYAREELTTPSCVTDVALEVFEATGLDFGAVDIIYQEKHDRAYALEVNTAPGLTGTTLENYVKMFKEMIE